MLSAEAVKSAADDILAAALVGDGWEAALQRFADASGARDAVLMRNVANRPVAVLSTEAAKGAVADYVAGRAPPNSRYTQIGHLPEAGFRVDHDDYRQAELDRDPYYQEFLRPNGVFWHANAVLASTRGSYVEISLKRALHVRPYDRADAALLDSALPELRAAARIAVRVLEAEVRGMSRVLAARSRLIVQLDGAGRVIDPPDDAALLATPLRVVGNRLRAVDPQCQASLDRAVHNAVGWPARLGLALLGGPQDSRGIVQVHPMPSRVRDIFHTAGALAVLIEQDSPASAVVEPDMLRVAFGLTEREASVAALLSAGLPLPEIAVRLSVTPETVRTYLKNAFEKLGVGRQAELVALVSRLQP